MTQSLNSEELLELKEFLTERMVDNMSTKDLEEYVSNDLFTYFDKLGETDLSLYGVSKDQGAKRLHVISDGQVIHGLPAFQKLWKEMPRYKILAILTNFPIVREIAALIYDKILAPLLYKSHLKRLQKNSEQS